MITSDLWIGVDAGTTQTKAILFNSVGTVIAEATVHVRSFYPHPGWVEQDPWDLVQAVIETIRAVLNDPRRQGRAIAGLGLANQGETVVAWDASTGQPLAPAIGWQCRRTESLCVQLKTTKLAPMIAAISGLPIDPYFSSTKMMWLLKKSEAVRAARQRGTLRLSTTDSWILHHLLTDPPYITDVATASRTQLLNIDVGVWSENLLEAFGIREVELPNIVPNAYIIGRTNKEKVGETIDVAGLAVDQQAALFGHGCVQTGQAKVSYGTGAFVLANAGHQRPNIPGLLPTIAWQLPGQRLVYAVDGGVLTAGAAIEWLVDMGILTSVEDSNEVENDIEDENLVFVPALAGLGAPWWNPAARGTVWGIHRGTTPHQLVQAVLRGIAHRIDDIVQQLYAHHGGLTELRCDGGPTRNPYLMQYQSDILGVPVKVSSIEDLAAWGVARLAMVAKGIDPNNSTPAAFTREYFPHRDGDWRLRQRARWRQAVRRAESLESQGDH
ncbi:MAG: FGGY family carbohydrate kinase [Firmicutes bacterium]|nr:FGGY family carbohydrate kinase [Bacillota bacterium]